MYKFLLMVLLLLIFLTLVDVGKELKIISHNMRIQNSYLKILTEKECDINLNQTFINQNDKEAGPPEEESKPTATNKSVIFTATAYDNSVESQGAWVGTTATGYSLTGKSLEEARTIAVDPKVIPLNSKVQLTFDDTYKHLNGIYYARDTGGAIKGNEIDIFMGDGVNKQVVRNFGRREVRLEVL